VKRIIKIAVAVVLCFGMLFMTGCGVQTEPDVVKLHIGAGPFEDPNFKGCVPAGQKDNSPTNDKYVAYPTSGRDYDAGTTKKSDSGPITVVSQDNTEMSIPIRITWDFNTDCKILEEFYKDYNRYGANLNDDGSQTEGWSNVLDKILGNSLDTTLDEIAKAYPWRALYNDATAQNEVQLALDERLQDIVDEVAKGKYFLDIKVATMKKPVPTNKDLVDAIAAEQAAVATAQSAEAKAKAQEAQANAEAATAAAEAKKQEAVIAGFGSYANFAQYTAIMQGLNPFQPTYIVGGTTGK